MKLWYPYTYEESGCVDTNSYLAMCTLDMSRFKILLNKNIITERWKLIAGKLNNLLHTDVIHGNDITSSFISSLTCGYDPSRNRCFYTVSPFSKVGKTRYSLIKTIRLCEYGNDTIPPTNWIRHSFLEFVDILAGEKHEC